MDTYALPYSALTRYKYELFDGHWVALQVVMTALCQHTLDDDPELFLLAELHLEDMVKFMRCTSC